MTCLLVAAGLALAATCAWIMLGTLPSLPATPATWAAMITAGACVAAVGRAWSCASDPTRAPALPKDQEENRWYPVILAPQQIPRKEGHLYLGRGRRLDWLLAQKIMDLAGAEVEGRPRQWQELIRQLMQGPEVEPLFLPIEQIYKHVRIHGATQTGKSRMLELLTVQLAELTNVALPMIDPKGDHRLANALYSSTRRLGTKWYWFSPQMPKMSIAYNPLRQFAEPGELGGRFRPMLPSTGTGEGEPYAQTQVEVVTALCNAFVDLGMTPNFHRLRMFCEEGGREAIFLQLLRHHYPASVGARWPGNARAAAEKYKQLQAAYQTREAECPPWFRPSVSVTGLLKVITGREVYSKMIISLLPLLVKLSDGSLKDLMSPEDDVPMFSWLRSERQHAISYFYMSAMSNGDLGRGLAKATFLDLLAHLGRKYSYRQHEIPQTPMIMIVDELGDVVLPEFNSAINKGSAAGLGIVCSSQVSHDVIAQLSLARWRQIEANTSTVIQFRTAQDDAQALSDRIGTAPVTIFNEQLSMEPTMFGSGDTTADDFRARFAHSGDQRWVARVPMEMVTSLPNGHFIMVRGSEVWLGEEPLLEDPQHAFVEEQKALMKDRPPGGTRPRDAAAVGAA